MTTTLTAAHDGKFVQVEDPQGRAVAGYFTFDPDPAYDPECIGYILPAGLRVYTSDTLIFHSNH